MAENQSGCQNIQLMATKTMPFRYLEGGLKHSIESLAYIFRVIIKERLVQIFSSIYSYS